jgi:hypothetical protein
MFVAVLQHGRGEVSTRFVKSVGTFLGSKAGSSLGSKAGSSAAPSRAVRSNRPHDDPRNPLAQERRCRAAAQQPHRPIPFTPRRRRRKYEQSWTGTVARHQLGKKPHLPYGQWRLWTRIAQSATCAAKSRARVIALWRQISGLRRIPDHPGPQGPHGTTAEGTMRAGSRP